MENKNINPMLLQPPVEAVIKYSERKQQWNNRLVCKLWNQKVLEWGQKYDLRTPQKRFFNTSLVVVKLMESLDMKDRINFSMSCKTVYGKTDHWRFPVKDTKVYKVLELQLNNNMHPTQNSFGSQLNYYVRNANKAVYVFAASMTMMLGTSAGYLTQAVVNAPIGILAAIERNKDKTKQGLIEASVNLTEQDLLNLQEEGVVENLEKATRFLQTLNPKMTEKGVLSAVNGFLKNNDKLINNASFMIGFCSLLYTFKDFIGTSIMNDWNKLGVDFRKQVNINIPRSILKEYGIRERDLPRLPVFCRCQILKTNDKLQFSMRFGYLSANDGGHVVSLSESENNIQNKICHITHRDVRKENQIPLVSLLVSTKSSTYKKIFG